MDVEVAFAARARGDFAGAGYGDATLTGLAPAGGEVEIGVGFLLAFGSFDGEFTEAFEFVADFQVGDTGDGSLGIEEGGELFAEGGSRTA